MSLKEYQRKRNFKQTPEPAGKVVARKKQQLQFVVQKHAASHLHYDFRLEMTGVLKSWAVPKGPSLNPNEKRLAVMVEDHPLSYAMFEGIIPKGQYGGGEVIVWDNGTWEPEGYPLQSLRAGKIKFQLSGKKLQGKWLLLRTNSKKDPNAWLLRKEKDAAANVKKDITLLRPESILTGKLLAIDSNKNTHDRLPKQSRKIINKENKATTKKSLRKIANWREPQLATLVDKPPAGNDWLFEVKYDGYRILAEVTSKSATLFTRNHNDWTSKFQTIAQALKTLKVDYALLDGEVVVLDQKGVSDFQALQNAMNQQANGALHYFIFDLLQLNGQAIAGLPLLERKKILQELLVKNKLNKQLHFSEHIEEQGIAFYQHACQLNLEGIMAKRKDKPYHFGRSEDWLKVKCKQRQEFIIVGITEPAGSRVAFGALLLAYYDDQHQLQYAGKVGTGFTTESLRELYKKFIRYKQGSSPFASSPLGLPKQKITWLKPKLVAEIEFSGWTKDNRIRHPSFQGLREDKAAEEIGKEISKKLERINLDKISGSVVAGVKISHPDKIYFPEIKVNKFTLAQYYEAVGDWILPYVKDRPLNILRCPEGIEGECFFQKHLTHKLPSSIEKISVPQAGKTMDSFMIRDLVGLIHLIQFGVIEIHTWGEYVSKPGFPDYLVFDIDPEPEISWQQIVETANLLKKVLSDLELVSFVKTTGGKGLHVVVPIKPIYPWPQAHAFAKAVANTLVKVNPKLYIATSSKVKRKGKIFIDYLRNTQGATAIAPYSARARQGAPIAVPVSWKELAKLTASNYFAIDNIQQRLAKLKNDPWKDFWQLKQTLSSDILKLIS